MGTTQRVFNTADDMFDFCMQYPRSTSRYTLRVDELVHYLDAWSCDVIYLSEDMAKHLRSTGKKCLLMVSWLRLLGHDVAPVIAARKSEEEMMKRNARNSYIREARQRAKLLLETINKARDNDCCLPSNLEELAELEEI